MANPITTAINWDFLNEPVWRWFLFIGALILIMTAWRAILMRGAD